MEGSVTSAPSAPIPAIDPEAYYELELTAPVIFGGRQHSPMHRVIIKGSAFPAFKDATIKVTKLPPGAEGKL